MQRITVLAAAVLLVQAPSVEAQQKVPRIGFLSANSSAAMAARVAAFQDGLRELGYVEGQSVEVRYAYAAGEPGRLTTLVAGLVQQQVEVIVTEGPTATRFAKQTAPATPIVMAQDPDPVGTGFVASLARPGGNVTGLASLRAELSGKRLELLKRAIPTLARVVVLGTSTTPGSAQSLRESEAAAVALGIQLDYLEIKAPQDLEPAFQIARHGRADAVVVLASPIVLSRRKQIAELAANARLPAIYYGREFVEDGGLMSYGVNVTDLFRRAATYVDRILKGAKPADLPVELPTRFDLAINLRAAQAIGLSIPPTLIAEADEVIE